MRLAEAAALARLLPSRPSQFVAEVTARLQAGVERLIRPPQYSPVSFDDLLQGIDGAATRPFSAALADPELRDVEASVSRAIAAVPPDAPLPVVHHGDFLLGRLCYAACRCIRPELAIETGVAYGVTSAFILAAMRANGSGLLVSIDRPHREAGADALVGSFVAEPFRAQWRLIRETSRSALPRVVLGTKAGLFVHDSRHTYRNIAFELRTVTPALAADSMVIADDVERNSAFADWCASARPRFSAVVQELKGKSLCGVALVQRDGGTRP